MTTTGDTPNAAGGDITLVKQDGVATVRLDRPAAGNALTRAMKARAVEIWADVRDDPAVRAVIVTGAGDRHFCTGADVREIAETGETPSSTTIAWSSLQNDVWKPVICAVNGLVAGGGLHFVADADIVVAASHATFVDTHVNVGQVGAVENVGLAHRMPLGTVLRMTLQGKAFRLSAQRALALGLVEEVVDLADLERVALEIATDIAANSPRAVQLSKQALWGSVGLPREEGIARAWAIAQSHWDHPDFTEGARAFAEKRPPQWEQD